MAQCWVPNATPQKELGPSKVIPPTDHTWLGNQKKTPEHLATLLGSCMYCGIMPLKSRITCHKGELDYQYSKSLDPIAYGAESQQYFLIFIHGNAIPLVSLSFGQLHGYNILIWAYWPHKRSFFIIPATKGLNSRNPSYCWRYSLLSIIPATEGLSSRKPFYRWRYSLLSIIITTKGLSNRKLSYCWRYLLLSIIPATKGPQQ